MAVIVALVLFAPYIVGSDTETEAGTMIWFRCVRYASRTNRLARLRVTAVPSFRVVVIPIRLCTNPFGRAKSANSEVTTFLPSS